MGKERKENQDVKVEEEVGLETIKDRIEIELGQEDGREPAVVWYHMTIKET